MNGLLSLKAGMTGAIVATAGSAAPEGWILCDGSAVSRTTYAALFALLGTACGAGDGSTTFNVPDLRGRTLIGAGQGSGLTDSARGATGGAETHALSEAEMPAHTHTTQFGSIEISQGGAGIGTLATGTAITKTSSSNGSGTAHANMQPFLALNYIIKA